MSPRFLDPTDKTVSFRASGGSRVHTIFVEEISATDPTVSLVRVWCCLKVLIRGCSSFELTDAAFPGGGLQKFSSRKRQYGRGNQLMTPAVTRSCSPVVESFVSTQSNFSYDLNSFSKLDYPGAWDSSSPTTTPAQHHEQSGAVAYKMEEEDRSSQLAPQDPLAAAYGDAAHAEKLADIGQDIDMRSARTTPPAMLLSQGFSSRRRRSVSHTIGAVGHAVNTTKLPGPMGFAMAFAVAALGLKTAVEKQGFLPSTPQKVCEKCDGYGVQQCHVCQGRGVLTWEGKLRHTDPCPLCFGSCLKKCTSCGGVKMKEGMSPAMVIKLQVKAGSNRK